MCQWALQASCILNASHLAGYGALPVLVLVRRKGLSLVTVAGGGAVPGAGPGTTHAGTVERGNFPGRGR